MLARDSFLFAAVASSLFVQGCIGLGCDAGGGAAQESKVTDVPSTASALDVQLGDGESAFDPLADGATLGVAHGPQGGQHVWTSVKLADVGLDTVQVNLSARYADDGSPAGTPSGWVAELSTPMGGVRTHAGMKNYVDPIAAPRLVVLRIEVIAADGRHGEDERTVTLTP
jgi:hypothetical protein